MVPELLSKMFAAHRITTEVQVTKPHGSETANEYRATDPYFLEGWPAWEAEAFQSGPVIFWSPRAQVRP